MIKILMLLFGNLFRAPFLINKMRYVAKHRERYGEEYCYKYAQRIVRYMQTVSKIRPHVHGVENLPQESGYVIFPNHQGKYDVMGIIATHPVSLTFVMDKAKSYSILIREFVNLLGAKRLELDNVRQNLKLITTMAQDVKEGKNYLIFPEGGYEMIGNKNKVHTFKPGAFKSATMAKAPIVPVALIDSYKAYNTFGTIRTVDVDVIYLKPLYYDDYKDMKTVDIALVVQERIMEAMRDYGADPD